MTLRLMGWRITGDIPDLPKMVLIVAPHSSNWDFIVGVAAKLALRLRVKYLGKDALFRFPLGFVMRRLGELTKASSCARTRTMLVCEGLQCRDEFGLAVCC